MYSIKINPNIPEKDLIKKILKYKQAVNDLIDIENDTKQNYQTHIKYKLIHNIPKLIIISFIILVVLIYFSTIQLTDFQKTILNNVIPFINGITIVLVGVYLWTVRKECHMMEKCIRDKRLEIYEYKKEEDILNWYDQIEKKSE
jgi:uncharacterized membrane protein (DUF485 family)